MKRTNHLLIAVIATGLLSACGGSSDTTEKKQLLRIGAPPVLLPAASLSEVFSGNRAQYTIRRTTEGFEVKDLTGNSPIVTVSGKDTLKFADLSLNLRITEKAKIISSSDLRSILELYVAFFNRVPDADGLSYWIDQFKAGMSLEQISQSFYEAALQYSAQTGYSKSMSDDDFVRIIYKNVLGRSGALAPPNADVQYWVNELKSRTKGNMISVMLNAARSYANDPSWSWVTRLLDNKIEVANYFAVAQALNFNSPETSITKTMEIVAKITPTDILVAKQSIAVPENSFISDITEIPATGSFKDCINPEMYTEGNRYETEMRTTSASEGTTNVSYKYSVNGNVWFKGNQVTEIGMEFTALDGYNAGTSALVKNYYKIDSEILYSYGSDSTTTLPVFGPFHVITSYSPALMTRLNMELNKAYSQTLNISIENDSKMYPGGQTVSSETTTQTFLGIETVTVPLGSFPACKVETIVSVNGTPSKTYQWLIAAGKYRGIPVKTLDETMDVSEATKILMYGSASM